MPVEGRVVLFKLLQSLTNMRPTPFTILHVVITLQALDKCPRLSKIAFRPLQFSLLLELLLEQKKKNDSLLSQLSNYFSKINWILTFIMSLTKKEDIAYTTTTAYTIGKILFKYTWSILTSIQKHLSMFGLYMYLYLSIFDVYWQIYRNTQYAFQWFHFVDKQL